MLFLVPDPYSIFRGMPQTLHIMHRKFRPILAKHNLIITPGRLLATTLRYLQEGTVIAGFFLPTPGRLDGVLAL